MTNEHDVRRVAARQQPKAVITHINQWQESRDPPDHVRGLLERGGVCTIYGEREPAFEHWRPILIERCPVEMTWADGLDGALHTTARSAYAGWIWDTINAALPAGTVVVDAQYIGPVRCDDEQCPADDCTLRWDVTDASGVVRRVDVPI